MEFPGSRYKVPQGLFSLGAGIHSGAIQSRDHSSTPPLDCFPSTWLTASFDTVPPYVRHLSFDKLRTWLRMLGSVDSTAGFMPQQESMLSGRRVYRSMRLDRLASTDRPLALRLGPEALPTPISTSSSANAPPTLARDKLTNLKNALKFGTIPLVGITIPYW